MQLFMTQYLPASTYVWPIRFLRNFKVFRFLIINSYECNSVYRNINTEKPKKYYFPIKYREKI